MQPDWSVVPVRWWHMAGITRLIRRTRRRRSSVAGPVDVREALLWAPRWSPSFGTVQSVWGAPVPGVPRTRSLVVEQSGRVIGLGQAQPRGEPRHWEIVYLALGAEAGDGDTPGASTSGYPDRRALQLLGRLCDAAIERHAERIFASVRDDNDAAAVFGQLNFAPVTREHTYIVPASLVLLASEAQDQGGAVARTSPGTDLAGLRRQERADAFGVHQLYRATTPPVVQLAEARRPQAWDLPRRALGGWSILDTRLSPGLVGRRWVIVSDGQTVAWMQLGLTRRGPHHLSLMINPMGDTPGTGGMAETMLGLALDHVRRSRVAPVIARVREHQWLECRALESVGFRLSETHVLMMKQLALTAPALRRQLVSVMERVVS